MKYLIDSNVAIYYCGLHLIKVNTNLLSDQLNDYTFSFLLKQVRRVEKPEEPKAAEPKPAE